jgi:hypothetical protein
MKNASRTHRLQAVFSGFFGSQRGRKKLKQIPDGCWDFEFDRRGKVIDCTPCAKAKCAECG